MAMLDGYGEGLVEYSDLILVQCPRCKSCARIFTPENAQDQDHPRHVGHESKRLLCIECGHIKDIHPVKRWDNELAYPHELYNEKEGVDWYFDLPLYLQTPCCGHKLWFFNYEHLLDIENYVQEHVRPSNLYYLGVNSRLPKWMKQSKNRDDVLKSIAKLKALK